MADNDAQTVEKHAKKAIPLDTYMFRWRIENFSKIPLKEIVRTEDFYLEPQCKWYAEIRKRNDECYFYLNWYANQPEIKVDYTILISNTAGKILHTETSIQIFTSVSTFADLIEKYCKLETFNEVDDVVLFTLHLKKIKTPANKWMNSFSTKEELHLKRLETLSNDFKNLYTNLDGTIVTLKFQDEETLSANKAVLSARSAVFAKMFQQKMTEKEDNVVGIDDISKSVMKHVVAFMYCGQVEEYDFDMALELYYAADKYAILDLREHCGYMMTTHLTMENAPKILYLADQHVDSTLKKAVIEFIVDQHREN